MSINETTRKRFAEVLEARSIPTFSKKYHGHIFALIIGIDDYPNHKLRGAVSDANAILAFLTTQLGVPHNNITQLLNKQATRVRIIYELEMLARKKEIPKDAAILIYFAGHGTQMPVPSDWVGYQANNNEIEAICPVDILQTHSNGTRIPAIPDRVLNCLIHEISEAHGNNIVAIFDCCHSGGLSRTSLLQPHFQTLSRAMNLSGHAMPGHIANPPPMPSEVDEAILERSKPLSVNEPRDRLVPAYVHIAAVSREQVADEIAAGGIFTTFLLDVLKSSPTAVDELSYKSLIGQICERMKQCFDDDFATRRQPRCEGLYIHRRIFSVDIRDRLITGTWSSEGSDAAQMRLDAGAAHGVLQTSKFAIFSEDTGTSSPLIENVGVQHANAHETILCLPSQSVSNLPSIIFAKVIPSESVTVLMETSELARTIELNPRDCLGITLTNQSDHQHDLRIRIEDDQIVFYWGREDTFRKLLGGRIPRTLPLEKIGRLLRVIRAFASFKYHLMRSGEDIQESELRVELKKIAGGIRKIAVGNNLLGEDSHVIVGPQGRSEALCLTVHHCIPNGPGLYVYILYFSSDLAIKPVFFPVYASNRVKSDDPTLTYNEKLSIGYGDGGKPLRFVLPAGIDKDLGYLKVFVTTKPVDFYPLLQQSPFVHNENDTETRSRGSSSTSVVQTLHDTSRMIPYHTLQSLRPGLQLEVTAHVRNLESNEEPDSGDWESESASWASLKYAVLQKRCEPSLNNT